MKQPIPFSGVILVILFIGGMLYLALFTNALVPKHMKEKPKGNQNEYVVYDPQQNQQQQDNYSTGETSYEEEQEELPLEPLFADEIDLSNWTVSPPATFKNLSVCLIMGKTDLDKKKYVTLNEALKKNMVVVHETQDVNQLSIDNNSKEYIYINSGDIVKGGQQDRTIQYDIVIAPKQKGLDLASFCVEHGRWSQRESENMGAFESSEKMISSTDLKVAAKKDKDQSKVWAEVEDYQVTTENSVNACYSYSAPVVMKDEVSESSLELTLENEELEKLQKEYRNAILQQLKNNNQVTGFAYFINGRLYGIDVYNNHRLFVDLFNKLLDASIAEAISVYDIKKEIPNVSSGDVISLLYANAQVYEDTEVNKQTQFRMSQHNSAKNVLIFTSFDKDEKAWLHRNWLEEGI